MNHLLDVIERLSVEIFRVHARAPVATSEATLINRLPFMERMAHIVISGSDLEIDFKTHFMIESVARVAGQRRLDYLPTETQCLDFMKEFCNVVAGRTKSELEAVGLTLGQSLPFSIHGYNEIFYAQPASGAARSAWQLRAANGAVVCSALVVARTAAVLHRLNSLLPASQAGAGDGMDLL